MWPDLVLEYYKSFKHEFLMSSSLSIWHYLRSKCQLLLSFGERKKLTFLFFQFFVLAPLNSFNQKIKVTFVALKMLNFMPELFCRIAKKYRNSDTVESANLNRPLNNCFLDKLRSIRRQIFNFKTKCKIFQKL